MSSATYTPTDTTTTERPGWATPLAVVTLAAIVAHIPLVARHVGILWDKEQYQFFPFVIGAVVWLLWSRWHESPPAPAGRAVWRLLPHCLLGLSVLMLAASVFLVSKWLSMVSLLIAMAAVFAWLGRERQIPYLWGIWLLLWLMVPLPMDYDERLIGFLQRLSSQLSSSVLDILGILHLMAGNVLTLPSKQLFVDDACSGIVSTMSVIACAMIYSVWRNRTLLHMVLLVVGGILWAVVMNLIRICTIAVAEHYWSLDLSSGFQHEMLGLAVFLGVFLMLVSTDVLLECLLMPIEVAHAGQHAARNPLVRLWNWYFRDRLVTQELEADETPLAPDSSSPGAKLRIAHIVPWVVAFLALGVVQLLWLPTTDQTATNRAIAYAKELNEDSLPAKVGPWQRQSFQMVERERDNIFGRYSQEYTFVHEDRRDLKTVVSLDFPFFGTWHELCDCYRGTGWTIRSRTIDKLDTGNGEEELQFVNGDMTESTMQQARLYFAGLDANGDGIRPVSPSGSSWLEKRWLMHQSMQVFQVQVFSTSVQEIDETIQQELRELLLVAQDVFREKIVGSSE